MKMTKKMRPYVLLSLLCLACSRREEPQVVGRMYAGTVVSAHGIAGSRASSPATRIETTVGTFFVYGLHSCVNGKRVNILSMSNSDKYLHVQDESHLWEMFD